MMKAKFVVVGVEKYNNSFGDVNAIHVEFRAVGGERVAKGYPNEGTDEDNTFSRWTPCATLNMTIQNPALFDSFKTGQKFYSYFTEATA